MQWIRADSGGRRLPGKIGMPATHGRIGPVAKSRQVTGPDKLNGVTGARVNFTLRRVGVDWREGTLEPSALIETLSRLGYKAHPFETHDGEAESERELKQLIRSLAIAGFAAMNIMLLS